MLYFYGLTSQEDHLKTVTSWLKTNGVSVEIKFADVNEDAKSHVQKYGFTVFPVLFDVDAMDNFTKFAEGGDIMGMSPDTIAHIKTLNPTKS